MTTDFMSSMSTFGKDSVTAAKDLLAINADLATKLLEKQLGFADIVISASEKQLDVVSVSEPQEYFAKQSALMEETASKFAEATQATTSLLQEAGEEFKGWFEKSVPST